MENPTAATLFETHHLAIYRYLRRMTRDGQLAEDLTQEVFLRVVGSRRSYVRQGREAAWLFTIARNLLRDQARRASRRPEVAGLGPERLTAIDPRQHLSLNLDEALDQLQQDERDAFLLREVAGLGYREIASVVGATPGAVRSIELSTT